jgi:hypothetical protein
MLAPVACTKSDEARSSIVIVQHRFDELKRHVPVD